MTVTGGTCAPNSTATISTYVVFNATVWLGSPVWRLLLAAQRLISLTRADRGYVGSKRPLGRDQPTNQSNSCIRVENGNITAIYQGTACNVDGATTFNLNGGQIIAVRPIASSVTLQIAEQF